MKIAHRKVLHTLEAARLRLLGLALIRVVVPTLAAVVLVRAAEPQITAGGVARIAYLVLVGAVALSAGDSILTIATERVYRRLYGRVHGPRSWSCEDCGREITAHEWTPRDAEAFMAHLGDPDAHGCTQGITAPGTVTGGAA